MHYDDAVAAFFPARPAGTPLPEAVTAGSPARRLRDAAEPLATHPIWSRRVNEAQAALGLDFLTGYVWGRAAALGEPTAAGAAAAFAWFEPTLVGAVLGMARAAAGRDALLTVRDCETAASIEEVLAGVGPGEELESTADLLLRAAGGLPVAGRPLFAGLHERALPTSPAARLQRACELLREARGDAHVAVAVGAALGPVEMNVLTELWLGMELGSHTGTRGWGPEAVAAAAQGLRERGWLDGDVLSATGRQARAALEARTDEAMAPVVADLGGQLEPVLARLQDWSASCVRAGAFPADVLKRAAG